MVESLAHPKVLRQPLSPVLILVHLHLHPSLPHALLVAFQLRPRALTSCDTRETLLRRRALPEIRLNAKDVLAKPCAHAMAGLEELPVVRA